MPGTRYSQYLKGLVITFDLILLLFVFVFFLNINSESSSESTLSLSIQNLKGHYKAFFLFCVSWLIIANSTGLYKTYRFSGFMEVFRRLGGQILLFALIVFAVSGIKQADLFSNVQTVYFILTYFSLLIIYKFIVFRLLKDYRTSGKNSRNVVLVGENENTTKLIELIENRTDFGFKILDQFFFDSNSNESSWLKSFDKFLHKNNLDLVLISLGGNLTQEQTKNAIDVAQKNYANIQFIPSTFFNMEQNLSIGYIDTFPILKFRKFPLDRLFNQIVKRCFDIIFSLMVIVCIFSWLFPFIIIGIIIDSGFPLFFNQKRNGLNGKEFECHKFRTMRPNKDSNSKPTEINDPRITRIGTILRKTSIDELPQFFNVLKGDMSIVGPRPHMISENNYYNDIVDEYALRHYVKPGITGLAQVRGYRGKIDTDKDMELRVTSDLYYIRNWSFFMDIFIILKTVLNVLKGDRNAI